MADGPIDRHRLDSWLTYLETLHPRSIDLGLDRVASVATSLGLDRHPPTVTVAGTNGKGSCVATLDALLRAQGLSTGVYTSPHLVAFNERMAINGQPASDQDIIAAFEAIDRARGQTTLSYFESATLAALWLFRRAGVDWQVLEVGLGGRLDAVNIIDADACVVTSIGLDHVDYLGDTREAIAPEKAGVARAGCPAVVAERDCPSTLVPALRDRGASPLVLGVDWLLEGRELQCPGGVRLSMPPVPGLRAENLAAAIVTLRALGQPITQSVLDHAFGQLHVRGRQQRVAFMERDWWFDVAHNRESAQALAEALAAAPALVGSRYTRHALLGVMSDKPLEAMIEVMAPEIDYWHLQTIPLPRAAETATLTALIRRCAPGSVCHAYPDARSARDGLLAASEAGDRVVVFGSFITVGDHLDWLEHRLAEGER